MKAVSLFEVLIVMSIFSILVVLTFPFSLTLINKTRADVEIKALAYVVYRQQQDALAGVNGKAYGIALYSDRYIAFTGNSLATADSKDTFIINDPIHMNTISLSSGNEIVFSPNTFRPSTNGYVLMSDTRNSYRLDVTSEGLVSYFSQ